MAKDLRVRGLPDLIHEELNNISDNLGVDFPVFIKHSRNDPSAG